MTDSPVDELYFQQGESVAYNGAATGIPWRAIVEVGEGGPTDNSAHPLNRSCWLLVPVTHGR
jgi:hypothetical protein